MSKGEFSNKLILWYGENHRDLPWRRTNDPYKIWLSEVILQQTRVSQGLPYYLTFIRNFPNVKSLAGASTEKVLRTWQGLGYYSRARNLHACAKVIVKDFGGKFPNNYKSLLDLPGIGEYTASAIASIAFQEPRPVVDGNVFRVLARVFGIHEDSSSALGKRRFYEKANELLDRTQPGDYNQALMEFGALQCTPKNPDCSSCTFTKVCYANKNALQNELPIKMKKAKTRVRYFNYLVFRKGRKIALRKRMENDIWKGLYDFHLVEGRHSVEKLTQSPQLATLLDVPVLLDHVSKYFRHVLTHQQIRARFIVFHLTGTSNSLRDFGLRLFTPEEINELPKPVLISHFLNGLKQLD